MSVYRINDNLPTTTKIATLSGQILEVSGKTEQGIFQKQEIDQLFSDLGFDRQFTQNTLLGNTLSTYSGWTHLLAESGYSIWKYTVSDYAYNANNQMYYDDELVSFKGLATSESATSFDSVLYYDSTLLTYTDDTTEAASENGTEFSVGLTSGDYLYFGEAETFAGIKLEFHTRGSNYTLKVEYYNGSWTELTSLTNTLVDNTSNFVSDGAITWTLPSDWTTVAVNSTTKYWVRVSSTTTPVTTAKIYYAIPYNSVPGLLALSSTQIQNEEWAWCSLGSSVYVTIPNNGNAAYEGNSYISSSSSTTNKQNFFVANHEYKLNHENSSYSGNTITLESGVAIGDLVYVSDQYTFNGADADSFAKRAVGVVQASGLIKFMAGLITNVSTVGNADIIPGDTLYLSTTPGKVTRTAPSGSGKIQQRVGIAVQYETSGAVVDMIMNIEAYPTILT